MSTLSRLNEYVQEHAPAVFKKIAQENKAALAKHLTKTALEESREVYFWVEYTGESKVSLETGQHYPVIGAVDDDFYRIVDESGEGYLYKLDHFKILTS